MDNHYKMFSCPPSLTRRKRPYGHVYSRMLWNATRNPVVALFVPNIIYPPTPTKKKNESFCCGTKYNKILSDNDNKYENHTWNYRERGFVRTPLEKLKIYENWPWPPPPDKHNIIPWKPPPFMKKCLELDPCMRILVNVAVASKGGKYIRPCQKQIKSGG